MNFAVLPPEINSGLMHAGPGSGPLLAAAAAWDGMAAELGSAAAAYGSVVSELTSGSWLGPSSAAMAAAAAPYVGWLAATGAGAEQTATQARAAAAAYEAAFAMTVPPPVIAANRAQLAALVATNIFGQNTAAIAATEAHYGAMWAQDVAAMYGYAGAATVATRLTPFEAPPRITNSAGQSAGTAAIPGALQALASPAQAISPLTYLSLLGLVTRPALWVVSLATSSSAAANASANGRVLLNNTQSILDNGDALAASQKELHLMGEEILELTKGLRPTGALGSAGLADLGAGRPPVLVSASMGQAAPAGGLSVPPSWVAAAPQIRAAAAALPISSVGAAPAAVSASAGTAFSEMALAGMGGSALAGTVSRGRQEHAGMTPGEHPTAPQRSLDNPVAEMAEGIRELGELRDAGLLTDWEFNQQKQRLLCRPLR